MTLFQQIWKERERERERKSKRFREISASAPPPSPSSNGNFLLVFLPCVVSKKKFEIVNPSVVPGKDHRVVLKKVMKTLSLCL